MARYTAEQIYAFAREAGFSPDRAATMTAIALAESGGKSSSHNSVGENSKGLWQINQAAHPQFADIDLFDPVQNARAAFKVSHGGDDISPWTTTHKGAAAKYLRFKEEAQAAAASYGDGPDRGMWAGVDGYGDHTSAGDARGGGAGMAPTSSTSSASDNVNIRQGTVAGTETGPDAPKAGEQFGIPLDEPAPQVQGFGNTVGGAPPSEHAGEQFGIPLDEDAARTAAPGTTPPPATNSGFQQQGLGSGDATKLGKFLDSAVAQSGDRYVFGAETKLNDPNPGVFDCSELVEWASHQAGVKMPDGAWAQYRHLQGGGHAMSVDEAIRTPGALLFSFSSDPLTGKPKAAHVAISLGNGKTIEAKGDKYGVGSWEANGKRFQYAGFIPEMSVDPSAMNFAPPPPPQATDPFTHRVNNDPAAMDNNPATVQSSHALTQAEPPPTLPPVPPVPPPPVDQPPVVEQPAIGDVDQDNQDDAMQHLAEWTAPEDHSLLGRIDLPDHIDPQTH
ncbi:MAG: NlpC/P60 family protein [Kibdelosporangium sp.]